MDKELQLLSTIIMLTTFENPDDLTKAKEWSFVADYRTKPLTEEMLKDISGQYFTYISM